MRCANVCFELATRYERCEPSFQIWIPAEHRHQQFAKESSKSLHDIILLASYGSSFLRDEHKI